MKLLNWLTAFFRGRHPEPESPPVPEDLVDVAYIGIGAHRAFTEADESELDQFEGQLSFIQSCIDKVYVLDGVWHEVEHEKRGVWAYDVAEVFGWTYGRHLLAGGDPSEAIDIARRIAGIDVPPKA